MMEPGLEESKPHCLHWEQAYIKKQEYELWIRLLAWTGEDMVSITKLNNTGERKHSCLTPLDSFNLFEIESSNNTVAVWWL